MASPNEISHNAHRDPSGEYSQLLPYPAKFDTTKEVTRNAMFNISKQKKDIEACLNVTNLKYCSKGGFGVIYKCEDQQDCERQYAIKILEATFSEPDYLTYWTTRTKSEMSCLKNLQHPNILKYVDHCWLDSEQIDRCYAAIKTELMDCTLDNHLTALKGPMDYPEFKRLFTQIASALVYMHDQMGVAHLDIKGSNIMINSNKDWKILDFGHAHFYTGPKEQALELHFFYGTLLYNCPCKRAQVPYCPFQSDSYSLGMVLWQCILGIDNVFCNKYDKDYAEKMKPAWRIINETFWPRLEEDEIGPHHLVARKLVAPLEERIFVRDALELFEQEDKLRLEAS